MTLLSDTRLEKIDDHLYVLAVAALFEGDFSIDWLMSLGTMKASKILQSLEKAMDKGLIRNKGEGTYSFASPRARLEIESPFTGKLKEHLHRKIADVLSNEILDEHEMIKAISSHLLFVDNDEKGCRSLLQAGGLFRRTFQPDKAAAVYEKIFSDMGTTDSAEADRLFIDAAIGYSKITASSHAAGLVLKILGQANLKAVKRGDNSRQAVLEMHLAKNEWLKNRYDVAFSHYEKGLHLAQEINDPLVNRSVNIFKTFFPYWHGRFSEAVQNYEQLVPEVSRYPRGRFHLLVESTIGSCYALTGNVGQSLGMLKSLLAHCLNIGDSNIANITRQGLGWVLLEIGRPHDALKHLEEAEKNRGSFQGILYEFGQLQALTIAYYFTGQVEKSHDTLKELILQRAGKPDAIISSPVLMELSRLIEKKQYPAVNGLGWETEIGACLKSGNLWVRGTAHRHMAQFMASRGCGDKDVFACLNVSIACLAESGHQLELARTRLEMGRQLLGSGKQGDAKKQVNAASEILMPVNPELIPDDLRFLIADLRSGENLLEEILQMGKEIVTIRSAKALARRIIATANRITGAERGAIFLYKKDAALLPDADCFFCEPPPGGKDPGRPVAVIDKTSDTPELVLRAAVNLGQSDIEAHPFKKSMRLIIDVARENKGKILKTSGRNDEHLSSAHTIRSCICVPLRLKNEVTGVLYHDNCYLPSAFRHSDLEILDYFAAWVAIAMDNARAYNEVREMNRALIEEKQYIEEQHHEIRHNDDMIGQSPAFLETLKLVDQVAESDSTILILGETGSGKEVIAGAVHRQSKRDGKPFIRVNCAALSETLITSELFGHEKGAFTGAGEMRTGRFELANGGTLFLDEIGEIPLDVQVRLLRVLQSKEFERVGGRQTLHSNFRLIAATNRNLDHEVAVGRFRKDLFYRLNVFPVHVPPLRKRPGDIPLLARHFLSLFSAKSSKPAPFIPDKEMEKLCRYDWPGNVRELENVMERGLLLSRGRFFKVPELSPGNKETPYDGQILSLEENERRMILKALEKTAGKIGGKGGAAELLQIHRNTLQSRMKKLGIKKGAACWHNQKDPA